MTKKLIGCVTALMLTSTLNADKNYQLGVSTTDIDNYSGKEISINYGLDNAKATNRNGFYWGMEIGINYLNTDLGNGYGTNGDLLLGYSPTKNMSVYGIGSGLVQKINDVEAAGFGFGGGIKYDISEKYTVVLDYKKYTMTMSIGEYDYKKSSLSIQYNW